MTDKTRLTGRPCKSRDLYDVQHVDVPVMIHSLQQRDRRAWSFGGGLRVLRLFSASSTCRQFVSS